MKKVLVVSSSPYISGAEISLNQLLERIDTKFQLMLITGNIDYFNNVKTVHAIKIDSVVNKVSWLHFLRQTIVNNYKCFYRIVKFKPELIYFNTTNSFLNLFWIGILFFFNVKKIWHIRDIGKNKRANKFLNYFSNLIICNSKFIYYQSALTSKKKVVYGGIDTAKYKPQIKNRKGQNKFKVVACIAQLTPWKNQLDFIRAVQIIHTKKPNVKFLLIGDILNPKDIVYKKLLIEEVENNNLKGIIEFIGFRNNIVEHFGEIDVLIHTAIEEPFGRVLIEAMSMQVPVVAYNSGGPKEIVEQNITGYLVNPYDYEKIAIQTISLLENDDLRLKLGKEGRKRIIEKFSIEAYVDRMEKIFLTT